MTTLDFLPPMGLKETVIRIKKESQIWGEEQIKRIARDNTVEGIVIGLIIGFIIGIIATMR